VSRKIHSQISGLVASIIESSNEYPDTIHLDAEPLPSKDTIIEILHLTRELLFPGYFGKQNLTSESASFHIGDLLITIHEKLQEQICLALKHQATKNKTIVYNLEEVSDQIVYTFFSQIPKIRAILATDVQAAFDGDPGTDDKSEIIFSYPGIFAVSVARLAHELYVQDVPLIPRIMTEYAHSITGIDIHAGAQIGSYFFIDHGTGVVIGETTIIGDHVKIYQGVTLGALSTRGGQSLRGVKRHPTLEDNVTVYSGASILGGNTLIGNGVVIGSNVFITKSVPHATKVSMKSPELLFKGDTPAEYKEPFVLDWVI